MFKIYLVNHNNIERRYIMKLQYLTKKDYLAKRLDINIYNTFVKEYNSTENLNKKKEVHNNFRNFVNFSLNKRLEIIRG